MTENSGLRRQDLQDPASVPELKNSGLRRQDLQDPASVPELPNSGRKLFFGLFVFPLIIAVGMAVLLCTVVLLTRESETPESLVASIKSGSPSKRWQKAFELSNEINLDRENLIRASGVMKEIIHILNDRKEYDAKTRSYMAIALGRFDNPEAVPALVAALHAEEDPEVQLHIIWALGMKKAPGITGDILPYLKNPDPGLRKTAAYVLGNLENPATAGPLEALLEDTERDVRWNAAIALARLGSEAGADELLKILDRETLAKQPGEPISEEQIEEIMVNAVRAAALLNRPDMLPVIAKLSNTDKSLKVREAAIRALEYQKDHSTKKQAVLQSPVS